MSKDLLNSSIKLADLLSLFNEKESVKSLELDTLLSLYIDLRKNNLREETIDYYVANVTFVFNYLKSMGIKETKDITKDLINSYVRYELSKGNKPITVNKRVQNLMMVMKYMSENGFISPPTFNFDKLKETKTKIKVVDTTDVQTVLDNLGLFPKKHQLVFLLLLYTGIRRNELAHIKVANIDFDNCIIHLDYTKCGPSRNCYFNDEISNLMKDVISTNSNKIWLFAHKDTHITNTRVSGILNEIKSKLHINVLSSHKLRHYYATQLLSNGANIMIVKELLGHSKLEMTQRYLDYNDKQIQKENDKFNPLNKFKKSTVVEDVPQSKKKEKA